MPDLQTIKRSASSHRRLIISVICLILGILLIPIGVTLLVPTTNIVSKQQEVDYTDCVDSHSLITEGKTVRCLDYRKTHEICMCQHLFNITEPLKGDDIIMYYELESYDQTAASYVKSRDDQQLSGSLSQQPAEQCGAYRFDESGKPIAPCGEIADSMFNDTFAITQVGREKKTLNATHYGMLKDKDIYRNPKRNESETLEDVFKGFAKPKSWTKNIWELDTENENNNGFENEQFIGWMTTSLKRKPYLRLDQKELEKSEYVLTVDYNYPPNKYNGTRKVIFVASTTVTDDSSYGAGVALVVIGSLALALAVVVVIVSVKEEGLAFFRRNSNK